MAGYFDTQFKLLPGSYVDPISMRRKARMEEKKKNIVTKPFVTMYRPRDPYVAQQRAFLRAKTRMYRSLSAKGEARSMALSAVRSEI